jgi:capsular exopolysaccharide synthesis family protein
MGKQAKRALKTIYDLFDPEAPETTEFRRIYTQVSRRAKTEKIRSLLFTSADRGEGKTTAAALFALVASLHQGLRTCLIDGDFHRPRVHELFAVPRDPGFADILGKDFSVESVLKSTRYETLKVIPAGGRYAFPSELLLPDRLAAVFGKLRLLFDLIVVDAPPLLPVSDPAVLAGELDGAALVVRAGMTRRDVALRGKKILEDCGASILGVIVNNIDDVLPYHYSYSYYGYGPDDRRPGEEKRRRSRQHDELKPTEPRKPKAVASERTAGTGG